MGRLRRRDLLRHGWVLEKIARSSRSKQVKKILHSLNTPQLRVVLLAFGEVLLGEIRVSGVVTRRIRRTVHKRRLKREVGSKAAIKRMLARSPPGYAERWRSFLSDVASCLPNSLEPFLSEVEQASSDKENVN